MSRPCGRQTEWDHQQQKLSQARLRSKLTSCFVWHNIFSLAKIAFWVKQYQPNFFYVNTLFDPDYFNIQTLPKNVKNIVNSRYSMLTDFKPTLRFMNAADRDTPEMRKQRTDRILKTDSYRHENFGEVFPLLNKVLQIYE